MPRRTMTEAYEHDFCSYPLIPLSDMIVAER